MTTTQCTKNKQNLNKGIREKSIEYGSMKPAVRNNTEYPAIIIPLFNGPGTVLQAGRSRVRFSMSLEFFIDIILLAAIWRWGRLSL